jgi:hypothetical protein
MAEIEFSDALDIGYSTLWDIRRKKPPLATYAYSTYQFFNTFFKGNVKTVGKALEGHVTLDSEANASHKGFWDADALVKKNIQKRYRIPWVLASGGMAWNLIEEAINSSPAAIYDAWESQYDSCVKDLVEEVFSKILTGPTSSTDTDNPYAVTTWLSQGTTGSTGGFTSYWGCYNDGSGTPAGSGFDKGGIAADTYTDWASYFADHDGSIDDSLLTILDEANLVLNFQPPTVPEKLPMESVKFATYTSKNVITSLNTFYAKADDNMGYHPHAHYGTPSFNRIPMVYCQPFDTANLDVYGTDPIVGINHSVIYPVILKGFDWKITKKGDDNRHNVMELYMDLVYNVWCNSSPKYGGYLVTSTTATPTE